MTTGTHYTVTQLIQVERLKLVELYLSSSLKTSWLRHFMKRAPNIVVRLLLRITGATYLILQCAA
jgi:hypothetical protein